MQTMKIIEGFYDVKEVGKVVRFQERLVKKSKMAGAEVCVEEAYSFYMRNRKSLTFKVRPLPGQMIVVVYYTTVGIAIEKEKVVRKKVKKIVNKVVEVVREVIEEVKVTLRSTFAKLMPTRKTIRNSRSFSPAELFDIEFRSHPGQMETSIILSAPVFEHCAIAA